MFSTETATEKFDKQTRRELGVPDETVFTGDALHARRLLWQAAADAPTRPTTASRPTPPRTGWDPYRARTDD